MFEVSQILEFLRYLYLHVSGAFELSPFSIVISVAVNHVKAESKFRYTPESSKASCD